ncbi:MAG: N-acetyltransferase [Planctomycetaceae bacterium]|nr:N-acetyltransferase [Planctomycetaceae bacterium]
MAQVHVRPAAAADLPGMDAVHRAAFPTDLEARLVTLLVERGKATISLVAQIDRQIVGHILFSPATLVSASVGLAGPAGPERRSDLALASQGSAGPAEPTGLGLAPVAVLPAFQNQGIGSALIRQGIVACRRQGVAWVVVLGHETYYPRFGFAPASRWNLTGDYGTTDAFQFLPLTAAADSLRGGHIRYAPEFGEIIGPVV